MNRIIFKTLGCRLNQTESEAMASAFKEAGFNISKTGNSDDVILVFINTCTVTSKAEQKARRIIRKCLKEFPQSIILVTGCYAQLSSLEIEAIDKRVLCFPGQSKDLLVNFPNEISSLSKSKNSSTVTEELATKIKTFRSNALDSKNQGFKLKTMKFKLATNTFSFHSRASLKIQDGCNNACTFCRVHIARGKSISLSVKEVIKRAKEIEAVGTQEIVLTGVNLSQYRNDGVNFSELLRIILESTNKISLRISSIYPETVTDDFLDVIKSERIRPHFHISIQSGSPRILKLMHRPADILKTTLAIEKLRTVKKNPFLGCDIITGFPTETEEDFKMTLDFCKKNKFTGIHAFSFSPRPDTIAYSMTPKIPERIAGERVNELKKLVNEQYNQYLENCNGKIFTGIIESNKTSEQTKILTENYLLLPIKDNKTDLYKAGAEIKIKIENGFAIPEL